MFSRFIGGFDLKWKVLADYEHYLRAFEKGFTFHHIDTTIASYSFDGFSSDPSRRLREFFSIQNQSKVFSAKEADYLRLVQYQFRIQERATALGFFIDKLSSNIFHHKKHKRKYFEFAAINY
jgi:hypothetical protein